MTTPKKYPAPNEDEKAALNDAMWDLLDNGATTLPPNYDPEQWIYWLKRYQGFAEVEVSSHDEIALILKGF